MSEPPRRAGVSFLGLALGEVFSMRFGLLGVIAALAIGSVAAAQPAPSASNSGPIPYSLGMTQAGVQASAPTQWTQQPGDGTSVTLNGGPRTPIGGQTFSPSLTFANGHLIRVALLAIIASPDQQTCIDATTSVVGALETGGPLAGAAAPWEQGVLASTVNAGASSVIRFYTNANGGLVAYANRRGPAYLEVLSGFGAIAAQQGATPTQSCLVLVSLSADPFPALVPHWERGAPSEADIARAQLLEHPQWTARPGADDFQRSYPAVAIDRNLEGHVTLDCLVQGNGSLKCRVSDETPAGLGFGQAAIDIARAFRAAPTVDGVRSAGKHVHVPITFRLS